MNLLQHETSPYLLQHKSNPVDWSPWSDATFARAAKEGKPVLLSVGYSSCHWCHVMAHESFEDPETAKIMNSHFVCIKVDREERPDVDQLYQQALALMGKQGGWPLTMFLTADRKPFWGGTYFPPEERFGAPSFKTVLLGVAKSHAEESDKVAHNAKSLKDALERLQQPPKAAPIAPGILEQIAAHLLTLVDPAQGGIGGAPKFPQAAVMGLLWDSYARTGKEEFRNAVVFSLSQMCQGGIYDHAGGGFHRYTVDDAWLVPHFEKMLYDNALLATLLADVLCETQNPLFAQRLRETTAFMLREMRAGDLFVTSFDADSAGEEGAYYVWTEEEIDAVLGPDAAFLKERCDVTKFGNWEGGNILNRLKSPAWLGEAEEARLSLLLGKLRNARESREKPFRDDKILADLNGLAVTALTRAAFVLDDGELLKAALAAFDALVALLQAPDGRLMHGKNISGFLDDYAFATEAALALFCATGEPRFLDRARTWADILLADFRDSADGGFFMAADGDRMPARLKSAHDTPVPSGNSVSIANFQKLYLFTGERKYDAAAEETLRAFAGAVRDNFFPCATYLRSLSFRLRPVTAVLTGEPLGPLEDVLRRVYVPGISVLRNPPPSLTVAAGKVTEAGKPAAFLCAGFSCRPPITDGGDLKTALAEARRHKSGANDS